MGDSILSEEIILQENEPTTSIGDSKIQSSIQYVVSEVSTLLNCNAEIKSKEQKNIAFYEANSTFSINASNIHKSPQISSSIYLRSNDSLLLSLTALLSNPHHSKYLNLMTENVMAAGTSQSKIQNPIGTDKANENSHSTRNKIVALIASNLQYYVFEGRVTALVINDLVFTLMKAFSNERDSKLVVDDFSKWEANSQAFIEAREWSALISPKECIFLRTCFELRELLTKRGIRLRSYFENDNSCSESSGNNTTITTDYIGFALHERQDSSIDEIDVQYMGRQATFSKITAYKHNNIPNYSQFEQIKKYISLNHPNVKSSFHNPGSSVYIIGNDIVTFLQILKGSVEGEMNVEGREVVENSKLFRQKDPYWFMKETKRIITNFPVRDTKFKASACDCNLIHGSTRNNNKGCYELNIKGLFLPHSLFVIVSGLKYLCPDIVSFHVSVETTIDPPFIPNEIKKIKHVWERIMPLLNSIVRSISPNLVEKAMIWKPFLKIDFKDQKIGEVGKVITSMNDQLQVLNNNFPVFSLPRKRLVHSTQVQNSQRNVLISNYKNSCVNMASLCNNYVKVPISQANVKQVLTTNMQNSIDFSISGGVIDNIQSNSAFITGINNQNFGSSSSIENQTSFNMSQPTSLVQTNLRTRVHNSLSANMSLLNFRNLGFSNSQNYVSLSTPMGRQLLHRIGTVNPIHRLESIYQTFSQVKINVKNGNSHLSTINSLENSIPQNQVKVFDETALCFVGFDSERREYFATRATEEGAKVVTLEQIEIEFLSRRSKNNTINGFVKSFLYSWLQVTRLYCVINFQCLNETITDEIKKIVEYQNVLFEAHQFVSLEWFLTACFEKRPLDPDLFTPISRPNLISPQSIKADNSDLNVDSMVIVILDSFPHMKKIYNSSRNCQAALSHAIWSNCMQRILKAIYGINIVNLKDFVGYLKDNCSMWKNGIPSSILVIPCNITPFDSNDNILVCNEVSFKRKPVAALFGSSKGRFNSDIEYIKKKLFEKSERGTDMKQINEIVRILTPYWLLESCSMRRKVEFSNFELDFINTTVRIQKKRKRTKPKTSEIIGSVLEQEEACIFFMKNDFASLEIECSSNLIKKYTKFNFVPSHGPWPLWGWKICVLSSCRGELLEKVNYKLIEIGAIVLYSSYSTEDIISFHLERRRDFGRALVRSEVNLIICDDFLVSKVSQFLKNIGIDNEISEPIIFRKIMGTKIVGESWVNMVYGTRSLHPFECRFYSENSKICGSEEVSSMGYTKKVECSQLEQNKDKQTHNESESNYGSKLVTDDTSNKLNNSKRRCEEPKKSKNNEQLNNSVNSRESSHKELNDENKFECLSNANVVPGIDNIKKRRVISTETEIFSKSFEKTIEDGVCPENSNYINNCNFKSNDVRGNYNGTNTESGEFLVPFSFSYFSGIIENGNKDVATTFVSTNTPIRKAKENDMHCCEGQSFQTPSNWISPSNNISDRYINMFSNKETKSGVYSQTEVEISYASSKTDTENVSTILCPVIPTNTLVFEL
ncbi:hypothetical protein RS030_152340 [Cryptosporidium xiaoi]|uniref:BRCT domain-containing protein n=1 Tax=Cryptosporidium xiaoi TaxID=659607 RepID=A0AAV9Y3H0_9CRYT